MKLVTWKLYWNTITVLTVQVFVLCYCQTLRSALWTNVDSKRSMQRNIPFSTFCCLFVVSNRVSLKEKSRELSCYRERHARACPRDYLKIRVKDHWHDNDNGDFAFNNKTSEQGVPLRETNNNTQSRIRWRINLYLSLGILSVMSDYYLSLLIGKRTSPFFWLLPDIGSWLKKAILVVCLKERSFLGGIYF